MNTKIEKHINDLLEGRKDLTDDQVKDLARKIYVQGQTDIRLGYREPHHEITDLAGEMNNMFNAITGS